MFNDFFQIGAIPDDQLIGIFNPFLVGLSFMVAVFASYIALDLTGRLRDPSNTKRKRLLWLLGGAIAMGSGIWSMHFIGMLSFSIPGVTLQYGLFWTAISLIVAIVASGFALFLLQLSIINFIHLITGGIILGLAIASMHYTGMEAMLVTLDFKYLPGLFFLSILIAIIASETAIWLALKSTRVILRVRNRVKLASAIIMGLAICGMHYTGMAASIFTPFCGVEPMSKGIGALDPTFLAIAIAAVTGVILSIAFFASTYQESLNQQKLEKMRQLGMAEISASVLHNVGNVLNSINVSVGSVNEEISTSRLSELSKLSALINANINNLSDFFRNDTRGQKIPEYLSNLDEYWKNQKLIILREINILIKNISLIKDIISTQQNLSKSPDLESLNSIPELIEESLLITGLSLKQDIKIQKRYEYTKAIMTDKVKLLQVLVNIFQNAKDAVIQSNKTDKLIIITLSILNKEKIIIEVSDNGIGILATNINKIFYHGFTTKEKGHGFGLHASILAIRELGGEIRVKSQGYEKGATFTIELPYKIPK